MKDSKVESEEKQLPIIKATVRFDNSKEFKLTDGEIRELERERESEEKKEPKHNVSTEMLVVDIFCRYAKDWIEGSENREEEIAKEVSELIEEHIHESEPVVEIPVKVSETWDEIFTAYNENAEQFFVDGEPVSLYHPLEFKEYLKKYYNVPTKQGF